MAHRPPYLHRFIHINMFPASFESQASLPSTYEDTEFLEFENITVAPIQPSLIDAALLNEEERQWINQYNASVAAKVRTR